MSYIKPPTRVKWTLELPTWSCFQVPCEPILTLEIASWPSVAYPPHQNYPHKKKGFISGLRDKQVANNPLQGGLLLVIKRVIPLMNRVISYNPIYPCTSPFIGVISYLQLIGTRPPCNKPNDFWWGCSWRGPWIRDLQLHTNRPHSLVRYSWCFK